jgi:hypothetical protein
LGTLRFSTDTIDTVDAEVHRKERKMRSREEAISELLREKNVRARCYDRWVTEGRLTATDAKDRLDRINAAIHFLELPGAIVEAAPTNVLPMEAVA